MGRLFKQHAELFPDLMYEKDVYPKRPGCDPDLICHGLEPITPVEREGMEGLSDVDTEILTHKLSSIVEEARDVYMALSISEGIISGDMNCGIFTASGDPVVVGTGIYFHTLLNNAQLKYILKYYRHDPSVGLADGDVFFFNEELAGGVHNLDMFTAMPIFWEGKLVAWAEVGGHQGDTGSITPGGFAPTAKSRYEEGFHMPAVRIGRNFELRRDILDYMGGTVRNPHVFIADLKSRTATLFQIRRRFLRELEKRGVESVVGGMRKILIRGEENARIRLKEINDGIFRSILFNDEHGTFFGLTRVPVTVFKEDDELIVLVQGVSPENIDGPFNSSWHLTRAATAVYLFSYFFRGLLPANAGLLEPVKYYIEGPSMMNSSAELAHGLANQTCAFVTQSMYMVGAKMLFASPHREAVQAPQSRNYSLPVMGGENRRGYYSVNYSSNANAGGGGGRYDMDGEHALGFYWGPWTDSGEVEEQDERLPHIVLSRRLDTNFHGFGKFRGGTPLLEVAMGPCGHEACSMSSWGSSDKLSFNFGLFGGYAGPPNPRTVLRDTNLLEKLSDGEDIELGQYALLTDQKLQAEYHLTSSSKDAEPLGENDLVIHSVGAGGGYGDVLERDPGLVRQDLDANLITQEVAEKIYGVVFDQETGEVNPQNTEKARAKIKRKRLQNGAPFKDFIKGWLKKNPKSSVISRYGEYPDPRFPGYSKAFWGLYK